MVFLPQLKSHERHQVTCENPVYAVVFRYDFLTEHARVLVFALLVNSDLIVRQKIIPRVDDAIMCVQAVTVIVYVVAQNVKAPADRYRNIRTLREKFKKELQKLSASVFILFGNVTVLAFHGQIVVYKIGRLQDEVVVQGYRNDTDLSDSFSRFCLNE